MKNMVGVPAFAAATTGVRKIPSDRKADHDHREVKEANAFLSYSCLFNMRVVAAAAVVPSSNSELVSDNEYSVLTLQRQTKIQPDDKTQLLSLMTFFYLQLSAQTKQPRFFWQTLQIPDPCRMSW